MNEETKLILENQNAIMNLLLVNVATRKNTTQYLLDQITKTATILNPNNKELTQEEIEEKTPVEEQTEEELYEPENKFGKRKQ